jgi:hypothetical protein
MFHLGQVIRCIVTRALSESGIKPALTMAQEYKIEAATKCSCGELHIDVGLKSEYNYVRCYKCGEELPHGDKIHWCNSSRFDLVISENP